MPRQFSLKTLLWLMVVLVALLGGAIAGSAWQKARDEAEWLRRESEGMPPLPPDSWPDENEPDEDDGPQRDN